MNERQRIQQIMEAEHLTAKVFAEQVGISAGTISNIMGGRNNPSLDVLQAILNRYRTISSDWLILGVGSMYRSTGDVQQPSLFAEPEPEPEPATPAQVVLPALPAQPVIEKKVAKIVVYYTDNTYEER